MQTVIDVGQQVATLINVFEVAPGKQDALVRLLDRATVEFMRHQPGFVSVTIHRSVDGTRVVSYAQWATAHDFGRMLGNADAQAHMKQAAAMAMAAPALYTVVSVHR